MRILNTKKTQIRDERRPNAFHEGFVKDARGSGKPGVLPLAAGRGRGDASRPTPRSTP